MDGLIPGRLILDEIRAVREELGAFRQDVAAWRQETGERIAALEAQVKPAIIGNGQPSRLAQIDERVTALERHHWRLAGAASAAGAGVALLVDVIRKKIGL